MYLSGWIFLLTSCLTVTGITFWCFYRVLTLPADAAVENEIHAPLDIETHEAE